MNIVILSAGLGTRLSPITDNLPKCLVPISGKAALLWQYRYYVPMYADRLIVVVHSKYKQALISFARLNDLKLDIRTHDEADGSASAIYSTCQDLEGESVLFNWSDIIPERLVGPIAKDSITNIAFLGTKASTRYSFDTNKLVKEPTEADGVIGLYYIASYEPIKPKLDSDFADLPIKYSSIELTERCYIDFGDLDKLAKAEIVNTNLSSGRYNVHIGADGWYYKTGDTVWREYAWYDKFQPGFAQITSATGIKTKQAPGFKLKYSPVFANGLLEQVKHKAKAGNITSVSLTMETVSKLYKRLEAFDGIIPSELEAKAKELMLDILIRLSEISNDTLVLQGHFDLNGENVFVDKSTNPVSYTMIDPRGYFGDSVFGPLAYETSKIYYGIIYWNYLPEYDIINKKAFKSVKLDNMQLSEEETLWLKVHLLTGFGVLHTNPALAIDALAYGLELIKELDG